MTIYILIFFTILLLGVLVYVIFIYNKIIKYKNDIDNAFSSVDVMLKKRHELIPNIVNAVKGYMSHEKNTLSEIVELRNNAGDRELDTSHKMMVENAITQSLGKLMIKVEDYPDLNSSKHFLQLQQALNETEEHISASRRFYNSAVVQFNKNIQVFPNNIIAPWFGFSKREVYEYKEIER